MAHAVKLLYINRRRRGDAAPTPTASHLTGFFVPMDRYEPKQIEQKWQRVWEDARAFDT